RAIADDANVGDGLALAAALEVDVHRFVNPVGPEDPQIQRRPAREPEVGLLQDRSWENDLATLDLIVDPPPLLDAIDEDLDRLLGPFGQRRPIADRDAALRHFEAFNRVADVGSKRFHDPKS